MRMRNEGGGERAWFEQSEVRVWVRDLMIGGLREVLIISGLLRNFLLVVVRCVYV